MLQPAQPRKSAKRAHGEVRGKDIFPVEVKKNGVEKT